MYLTQTQFDILRSWAQQTPQIEEAYLYGSYAKGEAHNGSDVDIAIKASAGNWTALTAKWELDLTDQLGVTSTSARSPILKSSNIVTPATCRLSR